MLKSLQHVSARALGNRLLHGAKALSTEPSQLMRLTTGTTTGSMMPSLFPPLTVTPLMASIMECIGVPKIERVDVPVEKTVFSVPDVDEISPSMLIPDPVMGCLCPVIVGFTEPVKSTPEPQVLACSRYHNEPDPVVVMVVLGTLIVTAPIIISFIQLIAVMFGFWLCVFGCILAPFISLAILVSLFS